MAKNAPLARKFDALLDALKFGAKNNKGVRKKSVNGYTLKVDFANERIIYGDKINSGDDTTANFSAQENLVVFDCVHRLLQKGYYPEHLTLEKRWKLGRTGKSGKADIVVRRLDSEKSLMIIECKTPGEEFDKEQDSMRKDGGQLFSYFQQDKAVSVLALYTNTVEMGKSNPQTKIVLTSDSPQNKRLQMENENDPVTYEKASTVGESLEVWKKRDKKTFRDHGVFEGDVEPYNPGFKPLRIGDLKEFQKGDRGKLHAAFMEILRHNNISDRSNAFNRFISLVLAKMVDEAKDSDAVADFQFKPGIDDADSLYERLQKLYAEAMKDYLKEEIVNHTLDKIRDLIEHFPRQTTQDDLYRIYRELKLYANNEFAFKEVYNERLYKENSQVLEEVVELFQGYKFKYDEKSQFLGDFFELMLEDGYKQTEGQFFTPTPVARFVVSALPLENIIKHKLRGKTLEKLPFIVDFACGSGHFLTESIEALQSILSDPGAKKQKALDNYRGHTRWARDFVWGVERDYRLARTSQAACFMHGDGDANIIFGDGLAKHPNRKMPEGKFDALVANPPYSIKDFKQHLRVSPKDFELWNAVSFESDDIEVFFIERMAQLLAVGGCAGIVLPASIFDSKDYDEARDLLMRYFEIKSIVQLGASAFSATPSKTIVLFLRRRDRQFSQNCRHIAESMIMNGDKRKEDFVANYALYRDFLQTRGITASDQEIKAAENHLSLLMRSAIYDEYRESFAASGDYKKMQRSRAFVAATRQEREQREQKLLAEYILHSECERFRYFLLTHRSENQTSKERKSGGFAQRWLPQSVCIVRNDGDKSQQRQFLGYEFKERRGSEGLHEIDGLLSDTVLDEQGKIQYPQAASPRRINYYVRRSFENEYPAPHSEVAKHCATANLRDLFIFDRLAFNGKINLDAPQQSQRAAEFSFKHPMVRLTEVCKLENTRPPEFDGAKPYYATGAIDISGVKQKPVAVTYKKRPGRADCYPPVNAVGFAKMKGARKVVFVDSGLAGAIFSNGFQFLVADENKITPEFLLAIVRSDFFQSQKDSETTDGILGGITQRSISELKIPLPPLQEQKKIAKDFSANDLHLTKLDKELAAARKRQTGGLEGHL